MVHHGPNEKKRAEARVQKRKNNECFYFRVLPWVSMPHTATTTPARANAAATMAMAPETPTEFNAKPMTSGASMEPTREQVAARLVPVTLILVG